MTNGETRLREAAQEYVSRCPMCNSGDECQDDLCYRFRAALAVPVQSRPDVASPTDEELRKIVNAIGGNWHNNLTNIQVYALADKYIRPLLVQAEVGVRRSISEEDWTSIVMGLRRSVGLNEQQAADACTVIARTLVDQEMVARPQAGVVTDAHKLPGVGERHQLSGKARQQGSEGTSEREAATRTLPTVSIPESVQAEVGAGDDEPLCANCGHSYAQHTKGIHHSQKYCRHCACPEWAARPDMAGGGMREAVIEELYKRHGHVLGARSIDEFADFVDVLVERREPEEERLKLARLDGMLSVLKEEFPSIPKSKDVTDWHVWAFGLDQQHRKRIVELERARAALAGGSQ